MMSSSYLESPAFDRNHDIEETYTESSGLVRKVVGNLAVNSHRYDFVASESLLRWRLGRQVRLNMMMAHGIRTRGEAIDEFCQLFKRIQTPNTRKYFVRWTKRGKRSMKSGVHKLAVITSGQKRHFLNIWRFRTAL
jgi:hypothetical protein